MKFMIPENEVKAFIKATNRDLNDRFSVFNMKDGENLKIINEILDNGGNENFSHFRKTGIRPFARTRLYLGFDEVLNRPVLIKTPKYRDKEERYIVSDYKKEEYINFRRQMIKEQIDMLNDIQSPLLPEPIDYFETENNDERIPAHLRKNEPVLVLDYQSGTSLQNYIQRRVAERANLIKNNLEDKNDESAQAKIKKTEDIEVREKFRIIKDIVTFLKELDSKNYAYQGLNPKSILLLRDKTPRFIGLGYICKTKNGFLDENHVNFRVCEMGYSAPELNNSNIPSDKISGKAVTAFSLGVLIHQLVGEYTIINSNIIGEYGHLKYPNDETVQDIKTSRLKGDLVHKLISNLCKEDAEKRLTDYDEILDNIEKIIGGNKISGALVELNKKYPKYENYTSGVLMTYGDTQINHCETDNSILKEVILGIGFYCRSKNSKIGFLNVPGYICEKCNNAYITEDTYIDIIEPCLDEIYNLEKEENNYNLQLDEDGELEPIYINRKDVISTYKQVSKMTTVNFNINECIYDDESLELIDAAVAYYKIGDKEKNTVGRITTKLLVCSKDCCKKVYITEAKLEELKKLLPDGNLYDFDYKDYKQELSVAYKIKRIDNINYCYEDLTKLKSYDVRIPYYGENNKVIGYKVAKLKYCSTCKTYYITKSQENELKSRLPKYAQNAFFKIRAKEKRISSNIIKIQDNKDTCYEDKNTLNNERVIINLKDENSKKSGYLVIAEMHYCKTCKTYYIKDKEIKRISELVPKGYKIHNLKNKKTEDNRNKPSNAKKVNKVILGENMILCINDNNKLTKERIAIESYDNRTKEFACTIIVDNKSYCSKCSTAYLDDNEVEKINKKLMYTHIKADKPNNAFNNKSAIDIALDAAFDRVNSLVKNVKKFWK